MKITIIKEPSFCKLSADDMIPHGYVEQAIKALVGKQLKTNRTREGLVRTFVSVLTVCDALRIKKPRDIRLCVGFLMAWQGLSYEDLPVAVQNSKNWTELREAIRLKYPSGKVTFTLGEYTFG